MVAIPEFRRLGLAAAHSGVVERQGHIEGDNGGSGGSLQYSTTHLSHIDLRKILNSTDKLDDTPLLQ